MSVAMLINTATGEEHPLPVAGRATLGRSHTCDIVINYDGVSRTHAQITVMRDSIVIEDLGSRNGTYVDTEMIAAPAPLQHGNIITIGRARLEFVTGQSDPRDTAETASLTTEDLMLHGIACMLPTTGPTHNILADAATGKDGAQDLPERLASLLDMNAVLSSIRSEGALLGKLASETGKMFTASERCVVAMKGGDGGDISIRSAAYTGKRERGEARLPISAAIVKRVMETGEAVMTTAAPVDVAFDAARQGQPKHIGAVMCSPLWLGRTVAGVLYVDAEPGSEGFTREDLKLLVVIAKQASLLLQGVHVYEDVSRQKQALSAQNERLRDAVSQRYDFTSIVGSSPAIQSVIEQIKKACNVDAGVLITGETGTGKELIARAIHYNGPRRGSEFVTVNCAAIAKDLQESEVFGHEKGAFTGAGAGREGLAEIADGGTLFLDEIGDMPLDLQAKLLRLVENKEIRRVGASRAMIVDVRIVAATNKDLAAQARDGNFRLDLYHRLNVLPIHVPPLSERREDIEEIAAHFLGMFCQSMGKRVAGFDPRAIEILRNAPWPGNVRELKNVVERLVIDVPEGETIRPGDLPWEIRASPGAQPEATGGRLDGMVSALEREAIAAALKRNDGNKSRTAEELGLSRGGLDRKLKRYGIDVAKD
ncbi:MAG: sigma 54-interacting transcriptional regulator [Planctomycetota bacterium]